MSVVFVLFLVDKVHLFRMQVVHESFFSCRCVGSVIRSRICSGVGVFWHDCTPLYTTVRLSPTDFLAGPLASGFSLWFHR